ncbi:hypothetical protein SISSUDRAFT_1068122 [Sistotremastrum suecicum HHB10207 ss-3]|uniref:Zinc finger PHD-type domain-containing protein n=1 Tax=Sistotremastrum suecicum HHB10207 ss-3 TaxID=1314776 RepID=A0A165WF79_9AGAM|nr:hypothetical protein SISSUDRAFT_1068122 [Sistotremastrum suecicum HHB10207 ss-3]
MGEAYKNRAKARRKKPVPQATNTLRISEAHSSRLAGSEKRRRSKASQNEAVEDDDAASGSDDDRGEEGPWMVDDDEEVEEQEFVDEEEEIAASDENGNDGDETDGCQAFGVHEGMSAGLNEIADEQNAQPADELEQHAIEESTDEMEVDAAPPTPAPDAGVRPTRASKRRTTARYKELFNLCTCDRIVTDEEITAGTNVIKCCSESCETRYFHMNCLDYISPSTVWLCDTCQDSADARPTKRGRKRA